MSGAKYVNSANSGAYAGVTAGAWHVNGAESGDHAGVVSGARYGNGASSGARNGSFCAQPMLTLETSYSSS